MSTSRFELTRYGWLKSLLKSRLLQPVLMLMTLFFFVLAILTGFAGTPAGNRNFAIIFVWIVWWALLIMVLVPFFGRMWCMVCPLPAPGEWLQRRAIVQRKPGRLFSLRRRWPKRLRNIWLQNFGFLAMAIFNTVILTRPGVTAWVLLGMILLAIGMSIAFEKRVFCRYVCPVGGFIGLYSLTSAIELRVKDAQVCKEHVTKDCVAGTACSYGCPWLIYPGNLERNTHCGMCMECLKSCPKNNIALNLRPFGADLLVAKGRSLDEAYKALIMLACALLYSAVLLGPWGWLKSWANLDSLSHWAIYAAGFLAINMLVLPGLFWLTAALSRRMARLDTPVKRLFIDYAYSLAPLGLIGWIAFSFSFVFVNGSYAIAVLSDPFGWGWNMFGTRDFPWMPFLPGLMTFLQTGLLLAGLVFSIVTAYRIGRQHAATNSQAWRGVLPVAGFLTSLTLVFLWLNLG